jgi:arginine decarboxylase
VFNTVVVLEHEFDMVVMDNRQLGVQPIITMRAKLCTKHAGHFNSTTGVND